MPFSRASIVLPPIVAHDLAVLCGLGGLRNGHPHRLLAYLMSHLSSPPTHHPRRNGENRRLSAASAATFSLDPGAPLIRRTTVGQLMYREEGMGWNCAIGPAQVGGGLWDARARAASLMQAARDGKASLTTAPYLAGHSIRYAVLQLHRDCTINHHHRNIVLSTATFHVEKGQRREVKMKKQRGWSESLVSVLQSMHRYALAQNALVGLLICPNGSRVLVSRGKASNPIVSSR